MRLTFINSSYSRVAEIYRLLETIGVDVMILPNIDFGKGGMLELLLDDFFFGEGDTRFNYAEFLKRHFQQVKEIKKIREEAPPEYRNEIKETYKFDFPALVEHLGDKWGYDLEEGDIQAIGALV